MANPPTGLNFREQRDWYAARCEELEDEIRRLNAEHRRDETEDFIAHVKLNLKVMPFVAKAIVALSSGRFVTDEGVCAASGRRDLDSLTDVSNYAKVIVCRARQALPANSIETVWGRGFRGTPEFVLFMSDMRAELLARQEAA